jgi:hypothetical protein
MRPAGPRDGGYAAAARLAARFGVAYDPRDGVDAPPRHLFAGPHGECDAIGGHWHAPTAPAPEKMRTPMTGLTGAVGTFEHVLRWDAQEFDRPVPLVPARQLAVGDTVAYFGGQAVITGTDTDDLNQLWLDLELHHIGSEEFRREPYPVGHQVPVLAFAQQPHVVFVRNYRNDPDAAHVGVYGPFDTSADAKAFADGLRESTWWNDHEARVCPVSPTQPQLAAALGGAASEELAAELAELLQMGLPGAGETTGVRYVIELLQAGLRRERDNATEHELRHRRADLAWPCRYGDEECPVLPPLGDTATTNGGTSS